MARRLFHLRRTSAPPPPEATRCDLVLISHLHHDHLHMPSVRRFDDDIPIVVPRGAPAVVKSLRRLVTIEAEPGDRIHVAGVDIEVLPARHDGARLKTSGTVNTRAMGFRLTSGGRSCWYPGDTGPMDFSAIDPVDLALVPIGGWGPSLVLTTSIRHRLSMLSPRSAPVGCCQFTTAPSGPWCCPRALDRIPIGSALRRPASERQPTPLGSTPRSSSRGSVSGSRCDEHRPRLGQPSSRPPAVGDRLERRTGAVTSLSSRPSMSSARSTPSRVRSAHTAAPAARRTKRS